MKFKSCEFINKFFKFNWSIYPKKKIMLTFGNENEMSTKIHIVFVNRVGLHPTSGDWRHRAGRECHIICVCTLYILLKSVSYELWPPHLACTQDVWGNTDTHPLFVLASGNTSTHTHKSLPQSKEGQIWHILCYESISDKSMWYILNLSTCNNNKIICSYFLTHNSFLYVFQWISIFLLFKLMHSLPPMAVCCEHLLQSARNYISSVSRVFIMQRL